MQVTGKRTKFLDRLGIAVRGHTDPVFLSPHINAGGMRVDEGHILEGGGVLLAFFSHTFLQSGGEREEPGKTGLLLRKDTRGGGERRDCFILIEPARSVIGRQTPGCSGRLPAYATLRLSGAAEPQRSASNGRLSWGEQAYNILSQYQ